MVFPVAVLLLCSAALAGCAKEEPGAIWDQDKPDVLEAITDIKASQGKAENLTQLEIIKLNKRLNDAEKVSRTQQAQIDALTARIERLHRKKRVVAKPAANQVTKTKHRTTAVKAPVAPVVAPTPVSIVDRAALAEAEKNTYTAAYLALKSGRFEEAAKAFNKQLDSYPEGEYADQAWYWLGEARLAQHSQQESALHAFKYVADHYPQSVKHASALLKLGQLSEMSSDKGAAVAYYSRLIKEHADSTLAEQARSALAELQGSPAVENQ